MRDFAHSLPMLLLRAREASMTGFRPVLTAHGLTEQQWRVLRALREHDGIEITALARATLLLQPSLSGVVQRLERDGLAQRRRHPNDGRKARIRMTRRGKALYEKIAPLIEQEYKSMQRRFSKRQWDGLYLSLQRLIAVYERTPASQKT